MLVRLLKTQRSSFCCGQLPVKAVINKMVFLAITPEGLQKALELMKNGEHHVWCGCDAMPALAGGGAKVSWFNYPLQGADQATLNETLETIQEHHPGQKIWVEAWV